MRFPARLAVVLTLVAIVPLAGAIHSPLEHDWGCAYEFALVTLTTPTGTFYLSFIDPVLTLETSVPSLYEESNHVASLQHGAADLVGSTDHPYCRAQALPDLFIF